jgi:hypothetical protein
VSAAIFLLNRPRRSIVRALLAVSVAWMTDIAFTAFFYNPAGIAAGHAAGAHFPEARFDNNTIATAIIGGWFFPSLVVAVLALWRRTQSRKSTVSR